MNTKYIIFDMDDTLLPSDRVIKKYTLDVLNKVQDLGHKIVINTARSKSFNQEYFDEIKPDYAILNGGSLIIDKNEKVLFKKVISAEVVNELIVDLIKISNNFSIYTENELFSSDPNFHSQGAQFFDFSKEILNKESLKIVGNFKNKELADKVAAKYDLIYVPYLEGKFGRMNRKDTSKESGNRELMKLLNASLDDAIVFGDDVGDLKMIQEAGVGVLMKNAKDELKEKVKNVSKYTNNEDGVARFLTEFFNINI